MGRAEDLKKYLKEGSNKKGRAVKENDKDSSGDDESDENKKFQKAMNKAIIVEKPNVKWEDIAGLEGAKEALKEAVILPIKFPHLFKGKQNKNIYSKNKNRKENELKNVFIHFIYKS